jgi:hypothetical protein
MLAFPTVVLGKSSIEVARYAAVMRLIVRLAEEYNINAVEAVHQTLSDEWHDQGTSLACQGVASQR